MFGSLSFEDAVRLFKEWGFQVEPGPRPEEISLIIEGSDYRSHTVYSAAMLPQIAAVALQVRWQSGALAAPPPQNGRGKATVTRQVAFPAGAASLLRQ